MATQDKDTGGKFELSRRDFLKATAAAAAVGAVGVDFAVYPAQALEWSRTRSLRPRVRTAPLSAGEGRGEGRRRDRHLRRRELPDQPRWSVLEGRRLLPAGHQTRGGSACPSTRRPVDGFDFTAQAWYRSGNDAWTPIGLDTAMTEIAQKLVAGP